MPTNKKIDNSNNKNKKKEVDDKSYILKEKKKFFEEENVSPEVKNVLEDVFTDIIKDDSGTDKNSVSIGSKTKKNDYETQELKGEQNINETIENDNSSVYSEKNIETINITSNENELKSIYENKAKDLQEKIEDYKKRYQKLEDTIEKYEDNNKNLIEKRKEYEISIKEFEQKTHSLEKSREEFGEKTDRLADARNQLIELSRDVEVKKSELEKRGKKLTKLQRFLEEFKYKLEKSKIEVETDRLEFEKERTQLEIEAKETDIEINANKLKDEKKQALIDVRKKEEKGKAEILQEILQELLHEGNFQSCFIIDGKGMLVSEYNKIELNSVAIGAMFSLITTTVLRTIKNLSLHELEYFKISSANGEFMLKNINIANYMRNFILLAHYDQSNSFIPNIKNKLEKKTIDKILKSVKKDFYEFREGTKISWIFDNLADKVNFLKQKYTIPEGDIEIIRINLLNKTAIKIKELFEL